MKMNKSKVIEYDFLFKFCRERDQNKHCKHHLYQVSISKLLCFCVVTFYLQINLHFNCAELLIKGSRPVS